MTDQPLDPSLKDLEAVLNSIGEGVYVLDTEGHVVLLNPAAERLLGWRTAELRGLRMHDVIHTRTETGQPLPREACLLMSALRSGQSVRVEEDVFVRRDGVVLPVTYTSSPIVSQGRIVGIVVTFRDITQRKQAERERAELFQRERRAHLEAELARRRLYDLLMQAPAAICILRGPEHVFEFANPQYFRITGHRPLLGRTVREALPEVEGQGFFELLDQVYRSGEPFHGSELPVQIYHERDNRIVLGQTFFNFIYHPIRDAEGAVEGIFVHAVEVTEQVRARHRAEQLARELALERDRLQQIIDTIPEGVAIADPRGQIVMSNAAARSIWGQWPPSVDAHGYDAFGVRRLDGSPYPSEEMPLARSVLRGETVLGEQMLLRNAETGQERPILVNSAPLKDTEGRIIGGVAVFQDISAIKAVERQKVEFLAAVSHDLKNPLATISGLAQLLQRRTATLPEGHGARFQSALRTIAETATSMAQMIDELLDSAHLQAGQPLKLRRSKVDLVALTRRIAEQYQQSSDRHRITVQADPAELVGSFDGPRLERVLGNLITNAVKYSPRGGAITLTIRRDDQREAALLAVRDEGLGIPAEDLPFIFEPFYRGSNVAGAIRGTGVGLHGVRQIVEQHGGSIVVESEEGKGTTFTLCLPLTSSATNVSQVPPR